MTVMEGFPCSSAGKESTCNVGDLGSIPGLGRSPGEREGYPLQDSGLEDSIDCVVHGVAKSWTHLNNFHFHFMMQGSGGPALWGSLGPPPYLMSTEGCSGSRNHDLYHHVQRQKEENEETRI